MTVTSVAVRSRRSSSTLPTRTRSPVSGSPPAVGRSPPSSAGGVTLHNPRGLLPDLDFVLVDDPKSTKNRVHLDVAPYEGENHAAEVARLVALGAEHIDVGQGPDSTWVVLADPEHNELCVLKPQQGVSNRIRLRKPDESATAEPVE